LIPRHRKVFNNNHFFRGMVLPSPREREPLEAKYPTASAHTISFLKACLQMDPSARSTCRELLAHAYFDSYREELDLMNENHINSASTATIGRGPRKRRQKYLAIIITWIYIRYLFRKFYRAYWQVATITFPNRPK
jgi:cyclin-dependent kinase-like